MGAMITLTAEDGHTLAGYRAAPPGNPRGALVIVQEIVTDGFAADGYVHVYPAGHGFDCDERGSYHEPRTKLARTRTVDFLKQHLG